MSFADEEHLKAIAMEWLNEATKPFPLFMLGGESFHMLETSAPQGGHTRDSSPDQLSLWYLLLSSQDMIRPDAGRNPQLTHDPLL